MAKKAQSILPALFTLFPNSKPLVIEDVELLPLEDQLKIVALKSLTTVEQRKKITASLYSKVPDLKNTAHKRIRFKSVLSAYSKARFQVASLAVSAWKPEQVPLRLFMFIVDRLEKFVEEGDEKNIKKEETSLDTHSRFIPYLIQFCNEEKFGGTQLLEFLETQKTKQALTFMRRICKKYDLKFGQFAKVKNLALLWFKAIDEMQKYPVASVNVTQALASPQSATPAAPGKWYWMDMEEVCWTPFSEGIQTLLDQSYANKVKQVEIKNGEYRVELTIGSNAGHMFEKGEDDEDDAIMIVKAEPEDDEIHGVAYVDEPQF